MRTCSLAHAVSFRQTPPDVVFLRLPITVTKLAGSFCTIFRLCVVSVAKRAKTVLAVNVLAIDGEFCDPAENVRVEAKVVLRDVEAAVC